MKKKLIIISVVLVILAWMGVTLANNKKEINKNNKAVDRSGIAIPVSVSTATKANGEGKLTIPAVLNPFEETDITVNAQGKLKNLKIELGSKVTKGQVLGAVDARLKELDLQATELSLKKLENDYLRFKDLYAGNAATEVNYADAKFNYENTKVRAEQIRKQIADGNVVSPINGTIVKKNIEVGEFVNPGTVIASVVDISKLKAMVMVNEKDVYNLHTGRKAIIRSDVFPGKEFKGEITYISPKGDDNHNYQVEVAVTNDNKQPLKAGTFVRVDFDINYAINGLQIPKSALVEGMKNPYIYIVKNNKTEARKLIIGREIGENVEVVNGLSEGEQIVTSGQINLADGSKVEIMNSSK
jgi:membrane fusion protein, multidrug efflux system